MSTVEQTIVLSKTNVLVVANRTELVLALMKRQLSLLFELGISEFKKKFFSTNHETGSHQTLLSF